MNKWVGATLSVPLIALLVAVGNGAGRRDPGVPIPSSPMPVPSATQLVFVTSPSPEFTASGGPYITSDHALQNALLRARAGGSGKANSPSRQVVGFMTYGDVVSWNHGSRTVRIADSREIYLVVLAMTYLPQHVQGAPTECHWVAVVIDATDGTARELACGPDGWPQTLPGPLANQVP